MRKYVVLRTREVRELLTPEEQGQLANLVEKLSAARRAKFPDKADPYFFVLNVMDKYALPALEGYIAAVDEDQTNQHNTGVTEARDAAYKARNHAIMFGTEKLPS